MNAARAGAFRQHCFSSSVTTAFIRAIYPLPAARNWRDVFELALIAKR
jgi:hypothetical protein